MPRFFRFFHARQAIKTGGLKKEREKEFAHIFADAIGHFKLFWMPNAASSTSSMEFNDFQRKQFTRTFCDPNYREFLDRFSKTRIFEVFLNLRSFAKSSFHRRNPSLFDEMVRSQMRWEWSILQIFLERSTASDDFYVTIPGISDKKRRCLVELNLKTFDLSVYKKKRENKLQRLTSFAVNNSSIRLGNEKNRFSLSPSDNVAFGKAFEFSLVKTSSSSTTSSSSIGDFGGTGQREKAIHFWARDKDHLEKWVLLLTLTLRCDSLRALRAMNQF